MMGAAQRWVRAGLAGISTVMTVGAAFGAEIVLMESDRVFRNFTREAAVVDPGQIRVEIRGLHSEELTQDHNPSKPPRCQTPGSGNCARLNTLGQRVLGVESVSGGVIDLLVSYGLTKNAEVGGIIPGYIEEINRDNGTSESSENLGDILLYGKFKFPVTEYASLATGLELTLPTGPDDEIVTVPGGTTVPDNRDGTASGFGNGALGINPFVSGRANWKRLGAETHFGYNFYSNDSVNRTFNFSTAFLIRLNTMGVFRTEFSGRVWDQFGDRVEDVVCMPGIDFNLSDNITVRPQGMVGLTPESLDWGIGTGVAMVF